MVVYKNFVDSPFSPVVSLQFDLRQLFKLLMAVIDFESKILLHDVFVNYFHGLIISGLFVGNL